MKTEMRKITPEIAAEMLKRNPGNRTISKKHVSNLADQMIRGLWFFDGSPIKTTESGSLLDGQHRLSAIVESNTTHDFLVVSGISTEAFKVMDTGRGRTPKDALGIKGVNNPAQMSFCGRWLLQYDDLGHVLKDKRDKTRSYSISEILECAVKYESEISEAIKVLEKFRTPLVSKNTIILLFIIFSRLNSIEAYTFISKICTGLDLDEGSAIYALRARLMQNISSASKIGEDDKRTLIIRAWNLYRQGKKCTSIRVTHNEIINPI